MAYAAWKAEERKIAADFGGQRALMKGTKEKADIIHPVYCIDVKLRNKLSVHKTFNELACYAQGEGKIPLITWRQKGKLLRLVIMDDYDLTEILNQQGYDSLLAVELVNGNHNMQTYFRDYKDSCGRSEVPYIIWIKDHVELAVVEYKRVLDTLVAWGGK